MQKRAYKKLISIDDHKTGNQIKGTNDSRHKVGYTAYLKRQH